MTEFNTFSLLPSIKKALDSLGFVQPTPIQAEVIPQLLEQPTRDIYAQAQTGTGKTLAFGIPLLQTINPAEKKTQGLILAPTRELVLQIAESLSQIARGSGITVEAVYGGMPIQKQIHAIKSGAHIVVGTPGRINDHLRRKTLPLTNLKAFILDEADIMLDMGFKEDIDIVLKHAPDECPIWLFSATFKPAIKHIIASYMENPLAVRVAQKELTSTQVGQYYCIVPSRQRVEALVRFIEADSEFYGIVFCQTKAQTSDVKDELVNYGFKAECLHGDMSQALRNKVIKGFKNRDFRILVATDVAARGIDVSDLTHVINMSLPREHENYVHRIGRTGRAGKEGTALLFVSPSEKSKLRQLERITHVTLKEMAVPSTQDLVRNAAESTKDALEKLLSEQKTSGSTEIQTIVAELLDGYSSEQQRSLLSILIQKHYFKKYSESEIKASFSGNDSQTRQELCIDLGRHDGLTDMLMYQYLKDVCDVDRSIIQKMRILDKKTFIELSDEKALGRCLEQLRQKPLLERKYRAYITEDAYTGSSKKDARPHDRYQKTNRSGYMHRKRRMRERK